MSKIEPPEGYEWCTVWESDRDEDDYPCCGFLDTKGTTHSVVAAFRDRTRPLIVIGFLRKKRPELPQEIIDAGWEYAASWDEAQKMGTSNRFGTHEVRACLLVGKSQAFPMCRESEDPKNKDFFVCWLKVKK